MECGRDLLFLGICTNNNWISLLISILQAHIPSMLERVRVITPTKSLKAKLCKSTHMAGRKTKVITKEPKGRGGKIDFPRITIADDVDLIAEVKSEYGRIVSYRNLAKLKLNTYNTRGGAFGQLVKSLKLHGLMDRYGLSEMKITDTGIEIVNTKDEVKKRELMFKQFLEVPVIKEYFTFYRTHGIPKKRKAIAERIFDQYKSKIGRRDAGRLAGILWKEFNYFKDIEPSRLPQIGPPKKPVARSIELPRTEAGAGSIADLIEFAELKQRLFPIEKELVDDTKTALKKLMELAKRYGFNFFSAYLESFLSTHKDKTDAELKEELERSVGIALDLFEKDL